MVYKIKSGLFLIILFFLAGCQSDISSIPDMPVHLERNINTYKLESSGSYLYIPKPIIAMEATGFGGILIVHAWDDNYYAFDLACPVEADRNVRVGKPNLNLICKCDSCGEEYDLSMGLGSRIKNNPKKQGLRRYTVSLDSYSNNLLVTR